MSTPSRVRIEYFLKFTNLISCLVCNQKCTDGNHRLVRDHHPAQRAARLRRQGEDAAAQDGRHPPDDPAAERQHERQVPLDRGRLPAAARLRQPGDQADHPGAGRHADARRAPRRAPQLPQAAAQHHAPAQGMPKNLYTTYLYRDNEW